MRRNIENQRSFEKTENRQVSVIIPVYNEADSITTTIQGLVEVMSNAGLEYEYKIAVVNDGSTDETESILRNNTFPNTESFTHVRNMGYGAALKTGIKNCDTEIIIITDADGTYPNARIPELIRIFQEGNCDMVVGARVGDNAEIPLIRKPAKWFITKLASYLTGTKIPDLNSGLRVMRREVVEKYINILPDSFSFTSTITLAMLTNGYSVKYVPIDYFKRKGRSKIKPIQDTLNFTQLIIRMALYFNPLKVFVPLSLALVCLALLVLVGSWLLTGRAMDITFSIIMMTSVIVLSIGMLADLIDKRIGR